MRIGVIGPTWPDGFSGNIIDTVTAMGHEAVAVGSSFALGGPYTSHAAAMVRNAFPWADERSQRRLARRALEQRCDVVINVERTLAPGVVRALRAGGVKVAFWFPDAVLNMGRQLMLLAPYDAIFFKEPHLVDRLGAVLDLPLFYLPEACHPRWHRPLTAPGTEPYLVTAGNMYPSRVRLLERLLAKGVPLKLYGPAFPRWVGPTPLREVHTGRLIFGAEKARVFRSAAGVLNSLHPSEFIGVNTRLFEAAGCGAAVLSEFRPALPSLFDVGREVLTFHDFDELVDQATRLLHEPALTGQLGDAAAARAHRDHSYERRITTILEKLT